MDGKLTTIIVVSTSTIGESQGFAESDCWIVVGIAGIFSCCLPLFDFYSRVYGPAQERVLASAIRNGPGHRVPLN